MALAQITSNWSWAEACRNVSGALRGEGVPLRVGDAKCYRGRCACLALRPQPPPTVILATFERWPPAKPWPAHWLAAEDVTERVTPGMVACALGAMALGWAALCAWVRHVSRRSGGGVKVVV